MPSSAARKFKLCQVLSQIDDTEIELLSEKELLAAYGRYEVLFGKGQRPPTDRDPTAEQLSAVQALLKSCQTPYADFAVFGPHGTRIFKKLRFQGLTLNKAGELVQSELYGPPTLAVWKACFETYTNLMVMLDAADLGLLLQYKSKVERLHDRFGDKTWALLYQADVRCRLEHLPRARVELKQRHLEAVALGNTTAYDDLRPWNEAYRAVADADKFWSEEFFEPALLVIADRSAMRTMLAPQRQRQTTHLDFCRRFRLPTRKQRSVQGIPTELAGTTRLLMASANSTARDFACARTFKTRPAHTLCEATGAVGTARSRTSAADAWATIR